MTDKNSEINLWVVRHGYRVDFRDPLWRGTAENPYNPPLATVGFEQAFETAERLKDEKIDFILASPFLRTIQTANIIAKMLGKKVILESGLSEWLSLKDFDYRPELGNPYSLVNEYPFIEPETEYLVNPVYPEDSNSLDKRIEQTISQIIKKYRTNILVISHGSPIKSIFKTLVGYKSEEYQSMCSVSMFHFKDGNWKLEINDDSRHLSIPDMTGAAFYKERWANLKKSREL